MSMPNKPYTIGKPFDIEELKKPVRARVVSPRDQELEKAITQAAAGAASQVIPFLFDLETDKVGTVFAAARPIVATMQVWCPWTSAPTPRCSRTRSCSAGVS
jgi:hypothetical protein